MSTPYNIVFQVQAQLDQASVARAARGVQNALRGAGSSININTSGAQANVSRLNSGLNATQATMGRMRQQANAMNATLSATVQVSAQAGNFFSNLAAQAGLAARRFLAFSVAAGSFMRIVQAFKEGTKAAIAFDLAMNKVSQVSGDTSDKIAAIRGEIGRLSTSLGVSSTELANVAVTLKQAGLSARDTKTALEAIALTDLAANFENMKQTTEGVIATWRQFKIEAKDFKNVLGSMNAVAGQFAVEASDLVTAVQKAGGAFAAIAGDAKDGQKALAEFMGLFTSVRATTRESADTIATGLRTIFTRLQRADTVSALKELGVNLRYTAQEARSLGDVNLTNQFVGAYEAVRRLSTGLSGLRETDTRFEQIIEQLGGFRQISKVIPLLKQYETAQDAVNTAISGQISLQTDAEKRQESLTNKISVIKEQYLDLFRQMANSKGFQALADSLLKVASAFAKILETAGPLLPVLTTLASIKLASSLTSVIPNFSRNFLAPLGSPITVHRAAGGHVPGVGSTDSVPALLTPGEFVINKRAASLIGSRTLHRLNAVGRYAKGGYVQRFADGGGVEKQVSELGLYSANVRFMKPVEAEAKKLGLALDDATQIFVTLDKNGRPAFAGFVQATKEATQSLKTVAKSGGEIKSIKGGAEKLARYASPTPLQFENAISGMLHGVIKDSTSKGGSIPKSAKDHKGAADTKLAETLARMDSQQKELFGKHLPIVSKVIGRRNDVTGEAYDKGVETLAFAALAHKGRPEEFKPYGLVAEKVNLKFRDLAKRGNVNSDSFVSNAKAGEEETRRRLRDYERGKNLALTETKLSASEQMGNGRRSQSRSAASEASAREERRILQNMLGGPAPTSHKEMQELAKQKGVSASGTTEQIAARIAEKVKSNQLAAHKSTISVSPETSTTSVLTPPVAAQSGSGGGGKIPPKKTASGGSFLPPEDKFGYSYIGGRPYLASDVPAEVPITPGLHVSDIPTLGVKRSGLSTKGKTFNVLPPVSVGAATAGFDARGIRQSAIPAASVATTQEVALADLTKVAKAQGLDTHEFNTLAASVRKAAASSGKLSQVMDGSVNALIQFDNGVARLKGLVQSGKGKVDESVVNNFRAGAAARHEQQDEAYRYEQKLRQMASRNGPSVESAPASSPSGLHTKILLDKVRTGELTASQARSLAGALPDAQQAAFDRRLHLTGKVAVYDKENNLVGGSILSSAKKQVDRQVAQRGGADVVSQMTKDELQQVAVVEQLTQTRRELLSAEKNALAKIIPNASAVERHRIAEENVTKALAGEERVVRDATGKILATSSTYQRAAGAALPGAGFSAGDGSLLGRVSGFAGGLRYHGDRLFGGLLSRLSTPSRLALAANSSPLGRVFSGSGAFAASLVVPMIGGMFDHAAGSPEDALARGSTGSYKTNKGISGGLQGAVVGGTIGATIGSVVPVIGTAIGGAVGAVGGGIAGGVSSLKDSEKEIRQVKINNALTSFKDKLAVIANVGAGNADFATTQAARTILAEVQSQTAEKNRGEATGFFSGFNLEAFQNLQTSSLRQNFGQQLPQFMQSLQRQADQIGRANVGGKVEDLSRHLRDGNNGLNREFLRIIAGIRGLSIDQVMKELHKNILGGQRAARAEQEHLTSRQTEEGNINSFNRLLLAVQSASDSLLTLRQQAQGLSNVFEGVVGASHVSSRADNLNQLGRLDSGALLPLDTIASVGGETGQRLRMAGGQADAAARVLPSILATEVAGAKGNINKEDLVTSITRQLSSQLGEGSEGIVSSIRHSLNELTKQGPGKLFDEVRIDTTKLTEQLLAPFAGPVKDTGGKIAKELETNANHFLDGLSKLANDIQRIGESYDQLANLRVSNYRQNLEFRAGRAGQHNQNLLLNAPLADLERGYNARQERLAEVQGPEAFDPNAIGRRLAKTREDLQVAQRRQQEVFQATGGRGQAFQEAAHRVLSLSKTASNLQQALRHLADVSARNATIQEKLNRLQQEREGRLGFVQRYAMASSEERVRMNRGLILANQANNQGNLNNFTPEQIRDIHDVLSGSPFTLTGFKDAPRSDDLLRKLFENSFGGMARLPKGMREQEQALQQEAQNRGGTAEDAMKELIRAQEDTTKSLHDTLKQLQNEFFTRLEADLKVLALQDKQNLQGQISDRQRQEGVLGGHRDLLSSLGIHTTAQLKAARGISGDLESFAGAAKLIDAEQKKYRDISQSEKFKTSFQTGELKDRKLSVFTKGYGEYVSGFLKDNFENIDEKQRSGISTRFSNIFQNKIVDKNWQNYLGNAATEEVRQQRIRGMLQKSLQEALGQELTRGDEGTTIGVNLKTYRGLQEKIAGHGINLDNLGTTDIEKLKRALAAFGDTDNKLEDFNSQIAKTAGLLALLNSLANPGAGEEKKEGKKFATGGNVVSHPGGPRGTDTVPAWLTPGEFVVRRDAARANLGLLRRINDSHGPLMLADGGVVDPRRRQVNPPRLPAGADPKWARLSTDELWERFKEAKPTDDNYEVFGQYLVERNEYDKAVKENHRQARERMDNAYRRAGVANRRRFGVPAEGARPFDEFRPRQEGAAAGAAPGLTPRQAQVAAARHARALAFQDVREQRRAQIAAARKQRDTFRQLTPAQRRAVVLSQGLAMQQQAQEEFAAQSHVASQIGLFNRRSALANGQSLPGAEAQRNVFGQTVQQQQNLEHEFVRANSVLYRQWLLRRNGHHGFATGGLVPGSGNTDSVPSLLTPGEFVLNQRAVARLGAHNLQRFNQGGLVQYHAQGGSVSAGGSGIGLSAEAVNSLNQLSATLNKFVQQSGGFGQAVQQMNQAFTAFGGHATALTEAINNMPKSLTLQGTHTVNVTFNGAEVLAKLTPEIQSMVVQEVRGSLSRIFKEQMPDAGVHLG